jgi:hypothetical protein
VRHLTQKSLERGKVTLTVPKTREGIIQRADKMAKRKGIPLSTLILNAVEEHLEKEEILIPDFDLEDKLNALSDEELIKLCRKSISSISGSLAEVVSRERDER